MANLAVVCLPAHNPSPMTGGGNNTFLIVGANGDAALVDAGVGEPQHLADLDRELRGRSARLTRVLVTHGHADHAAGAPSLAARHAVAEFAKYPWPEEDAKYAVPWRALAEGDRVDVGEEPIVAMHTPGHSPDHLALWHEPTRTVFAGDLVEAGRSVMIHTSRGGSLVEYLASLERLLALRPRRLLPAHGPEPADPIALLSGYLDHRRDRERQVVAALAAGHSTVPAIAESIYPGLEASLMAAARENVRAHLEKLKAEARAAVDEDDAGRWRLCGQGH